MLILRQSEGRSRNVPFHRTVEIDLNTDLRKLFTPMSFVALCCSMPTTSSTCIRPINWLAFSSIDAYASLIVISTPDRWPCPLCRRWARRSIAHTSASGRSVSLCICAAVRPCCTPRADTQQQRRQSVHNALCCGGERGRAGVGESQGARGVLQGLDRGAGARVCGHDSVARTELERYCGRGLTVRVRVGK